MPDHLLNVEADDQKLLVQVVDYYHRTLKASREALAYLQERGITNGQAIEQFRIGYADRTLGLKLPSKQVKAGREIRGRLTGLGLYRASGHEHFNGCVTFPIMAADGTHRIVDLYGRKTLGEKLKKRCPLDVYLSNQRRGVWNIEAFAATEEVVLCPSIFDALVLWNHGYRNVTCAFNGAVIDDHLAAFAEFKIKRVLTPVEALTPKLIEAGIDCYLLKLPNGLSINAYALQVPNPADALGAVLRKAEWLGKGTPPPKVAIPVPPVIVPTPMPVARNDADDVDGMPEDDGGELLDDDDEQAEQELDEEAEAEEPAVVTESEPADIAVQPPILTASPLPAAPQEDDADQNGDEVVSVAVGEWPWSARGPHRRIARCSGSPAPGRSRCRSWSGRSSYRRAFVAQTAAELSVDEPTIKKDLGRVLLKLEELQEHRGCQQARQ